MFVLSKIIHNLNTIKPVNATIVDGTLGLGAQLDRCVLQFTVESCLGGRALIEGGATKLHSIASTANQSIHQTREKCSLCHSVTM